MLTRSVRKRTISCCKFFTKLWIYKNMNCHTVLINSVLSHLFFAAHLQHQHNFKQLEQTTMRTITLNFSISRHFLVFVYLTAAVKFFLFKNFPRVIIKTSCQKKTHTACMCICWRLCTTAIMPTHVHHWQVGGESMSDKNKARDADSTLHSRLTSSRTK